MKIYRFLVIGVVAALVGLVTPPAGMDTASAGDLPTKDAKILNEAGIPLYEGAVFTNGGLGDDVVGARFVSSACGE
ncbi:MAG: hypothetical protein ACE5GY_06550 [Thermodesulfobacteriota bacterium]